MKGRRSTLIVEKPARYGVNQMIKVKIISKVGCKNGVPSDRMQGEEQGHLWGIPAREAAWESNHITKQLSSYPPKNQGPKRSGETKASQVKEDRRTWRLMVTHQWNGELFVRKCISTKGLLWKLRWGVACQGSACMHACLFLHFHSHAGRLCSGPLWKMHTRVLERNGHQGTNLFSDVLGETLILHWNFSVGSRGFETKPKALLRKSGIKP